MNTLYAQRITYRETLQTYYDQYGRLVYSVSREQIIERVPMVHHQNALATQPNSQQQVLEVSVIDRVGRAIGNFVGGVIS